MLSVVVAHDETCGLFFDGPGRREAALSFGQGDQAVSVASSKNVRALEWTHCLSPLLITPALWRQSAFMIIRAADTASLTGKINLMSQTRSIGCFRGMPACLFQLFKG